MKLDEHINTSNTSVSELIGAMYDAVIDPDVMIDDIIPVWDEAFVEKIIHSADENIIAGLSKTEMTKHFARANKIFEITSRTSTQVSLENITTRQNCAALIVDPHGKVLQLNPAAQSLTLFSVGENLYTPETYSDIAQELKTALSELRNVGPNEPQRRVVKGHRNDTHAVILFVLENLPQEQWPTGHSTPLVLIRASEILWNADAEALLQQCFDLTDVELALVRYFNGGKTIAQIAKARRRSVATVRTQVKSLLQKTGVNSQIELLRLIMGLLQISAFAPAQKNKTQRAWVGGASYRTTNTIILPDGRRLEYVDHGAKNGQPVLMIQPTATPFLPRKTIDMVAKKGMRIVSPFRPGSGQTTNVKNRHGKNAIAQDYVHLLRHLGWKQSTVVGQCTGSPYALRIADLYSEKFTGVMLVNSGAPMENMDMFKAMPIHSRRTFMTARKFTPALYLPHKIGASLFKAGGEKRKKLIHYFFEIHPCDLEALNDPEVYTIAVENMRHSLENPVRACDDMGRKVQDWSAEALRLADKMPIQLLQGEDHLEFSSEDALSFAQRHPNIFTTTQPASAKLIVYAFPDVFVNTLSDVVFRDAN